MDMVSFSFDTLLSLMAYYLRTDFLLLIVESSNSFVERVYTNCEEYEFRLTPMLL